MPHVTVENPQSYLLANAAKPLLDQKSGRSELERSINLKTRYPISFRFIFRSNLLWFALFIFAVVLYLWLNGAAAIPTDWSDAALKKMAIIAGTGLVLLARLTYAELFRLTYRYSITGKNLVIRRGIILRESVAIPLSRVTEVYLRRTVADFILGLAYLAISTPTESSSRFALINGLALSTATKLQSQILELAAEAKDEAAGH